MQQPKILAGRNTLRATHQKVYNSLEIQFDILVFGHQYILGTLDQNNDVILARQFGHEDLEIYIPLSQDLYKISKDIATIRFQGNILNLQFHKDTFDTETQEAFAKQAQKIVTAWYTKKTKNN